MPIGSLLPTNSLLPVGSLLPIGSFLPTDSLLPIGSLSFLLQTQPCAASRQPAFPLKYPWPDMALGVMQDHLKADTVHYTGTRCGDFHACISVSPVCTQHVARQPYLDRSSKPRACFIARAFPFVHHIGLKSAAAGLLPGTQQAPDHSRPDGRLAQAVVDHVAATAAAVSGRGGLHSLQKLELCATQIMRATVSVGSCSIHGIMLYHWCSLAVHNSEYCLC